MTLRTRVSTFLIYMDVLAGCGHARRPRRLTLADKNECMMKTRVFGQQWRSSCWKRCERENQRNVRHNHSQTITDLIQIHKLLILAEFIFRYSNVKNTRILLFGFRYYLQQGPTINHDTNQRTPLTISASGPPKSRNIMRTPSSEDILRCSKGCCSRTLFLTPISSVNSVKPSSMWTPKVHSFPFQLQAARNENKKRC